MIDEQAGQSTPAPRQWNEGDPKPPADVTLLQAPDGWFAKRIDGWWFVRTPDEPTPVGESGWPWENNNIWPLTEITAPPSSASPSGENTTPVGAEGQDDSPTAQATSEPWTLHTAITAGIKCGLADFGAELTGCTASALTGHVITQLRESGLHPSSPLPDSETERGRALAEIRDALAVRDADTAVPDAYVVDTVRAVLKEVQP